MSDPQETTRGGEDQPQPEVSQETASPGPAKPHKRRRRWIRLDLQSKVVLGSLLVAVLVLGINFQFCLLGLLYIKDSAPPTSIEALESVTSLMMKEFIISLLFAIPLSIVVGVVYSFRFSGPIYRFQRFLHSFAEGRWDGTCQLRRGDHLQDVRDSINRVVSALTDRIRRQHCSLIAAQDVLRESSPSPDRVEELLREIEEHDGEFRRRFGQASAQESGADVRAEASAGQAVPQA